MPGRGVIDPSPPGPLSVLEQLHLVVLKALYGTAGVGLGARPAFLGVALVEDSLVPPTGDLVDTRDVHYPILFE